MSEDRQIRFLWLAVLLIWLVVTVPLASGDRTLFFRDVFKTHLPYKSFGAAQLAEGRIPALNPDWSLGQPFRGNPSTLAFYPGNLLYLVLPLRIAFNLHFALHWLLALVALWFLARELGQGRRAALAAGVTYAGCGWTLAGLSLYNILTVTAWWPLVLWGMARGGRRGLALGGLACGLAFLGGGPLTFALGLAPLALLAVLRHGAAGGFARLAVLGAWALPVAAPQLVATLRVLPFTFRGGHGLISASANFFWLHPVRLLELIVPFPLGPPDWVGPRGFQPTDALPLIPYVPTIHMGVAGLALALVASRRRKAWALLAFAGLLLAWLAGVFADEVWLLTGGRFHAPEKFLFWFALAAALLAGWGVDELGRKDRWRRFKSHAVALQIVGLLALAPLVMTDEAAFYFEARGWAARLPHGTSLAPLASERHFLSYERDGPRALFLRGMADLALTPASVVHGLRLPVTGGREGMHATFSTFVELNLRALDWPQRLTWYRCLGVEALIAKEEVASPHVRLLDRRAYAGNVFSLYQVVEPAPRVWWPRETRTAAGPIEAFRRISHSGDAVAAVYVPYPLEHRPGARVELTAEAPDRLEIEVDGDGGVLAVQRAYLPLYRASAGEEELETLPLNLALLGVVVPPGRHTVVLRITAWPELAAGAVALAAALGALVTAWWRPRRAEVSGDVPSLTARHAPGE